MAVARQLELVDSIEFAAEGEMKTVELLYGDITTLPLENKVDLILISAFCDDYTLARGSVIGSLFHSLGVDVSELARDKERDLRKIFGCWWSKPLPDHIPYIRLMCVEQDCVPAFFSRSDSQIQKVVNSIFKSLVPEKSLFTYGSIISPILNTGSQGRDIKRMLTSLVNGAIHWMKNGLYIKNFKVVVYRLSSINYDELYNEFKDLKFKYHQGNEMYRSSTDDSMTLTINSLKTLNVCEEQQQKQLQVPESVIEKSVLMQSVIDEPYSTSGIQHRKCTDAIARYFSLNGLSPRLVDDPSFVQMVGTLNSRYEVPDHSYFSKISFPSMFNATLAKVKAELYGAEYFALAVNQYQSFDLHRFVTLTCHYVDSQWALKKTMLQTLYLAGNDGVSDHTIDNVLVDWNLNPEYLAAITLARGEKLKGSFKKYDTPTVPCIAYVLHEAMQDALDEDPIIKNSLTAMRKIVSYFSATHTKIKALEKTQDSCSLPYRPLMNDSNERLNSSYHAIQRFLEQETAIKTSLNQSSPEENDMMSIEPPVSTLKSVARGLKLVSQIAVMFNNESGVSISTILPTVSSLKKLLSNEKEDSCASKIQHGLLRTLQQEFEAPSMLRFLQKATFFDPRFKAKYPSTDMYSIIQAEVLPKTKSSEEFEEHPPNAILKPASLGDWLNECEKDTAEVDSSESIATELSLYMSLPVLLDKNHNPLGWWSQNAATFPHLAPLAKKYLCIPATCVLSDRLQKAIYNVISEYGLKPAKVNQLTFLAANLS